MLRKALLERGGLRKNDFFTDKLTLVGARAPARAPLVKTSNV